MPAQRISPITGRSCAISDLTRPGVAVPMVSAIENRSTPRSRAALAMSSTRWGGVGPSNGQSHAVATTTSTVTSLSCAMATISSICSVACGAAAPDVGFAERVAGGHHVFDRTQPCGDGPLGAVRAGDQRGELDVGVVVQVRGKLGGIGHRRHLGRRHERGGLHLAHAGGGDGGQQFQLGRQRDWLFDLQSVAQRHLANVNVCHHITSSARNSSSSLGGLAEQADVDVVVVLARACRAGVADAAR